MPTRLNYEEIDERIDIECIDISPDPFICEDTEVHNDHNIDPSLTVS